MQEVNEDSISTFSEEIVDFIDKVKDSNYFEDIKQTKIIVECLSNEKNNLATYIYMDGYNDMRKRNELEPSDYIKRALNIEYIY